jgi:inner membrane transporter RhtA
VVPYALDQLVFPRLAASHFALLSTLLPATAAVTGAVVLGQVPTAVETAGIGLVIAAVAITER